MNLPRFREHLETQPAEKTLFDGVFGLWQRLQAFLNSTHQRTLPFGDYVVDRWEKARILGFGEGSSVYDSCLVLGNVSLGENTWVGPFTILDGLGGLRIGSHCDISAGVQIYTHDTIQRAITGGEKPIEYAETCIGDRCYIGPNTIITKGITIGDGCIIGANSLVLEDIPANSKAFGNPCKVMGKAQ